jgi:hypothetical protein
MSEKPLQSEKKSNGYVVRRYRYTNDYQVIPSLNPKGGRENRMFYIGSWIHPTNDEVEFKRLIFGMRLLTAVAVAAVLAALAVLPGPLTHKWFLPILVISSFPLAYQIMGAVMLPAKTTPMERRQYDKGILRTGHSAMFAFVVICMSALACLIYWIIAVAATIKGEAPYSLMDGVFAAMLVLGGVAELRVYRLSKQIKTELLDNDAYRP